MDLDTIIILSSTYNHQMFNPKKTYKAFKSNETEVVTYTLQLMY